MLKMYFELHFCDCCKERVNDGISFSVQAQRPHTRQAVIDTSGEF